MKRSGSVKSWLILLIVLILLTAILIFFFRKKVDEPVPDPPIEILRSDGLPDKSFSYREVTELTDEQKDTTLLGKVFEIQCENQNVSKFKLRFINSVTGIDDPDARVAIWDGQNWQELKTEHLDGGISSDCDRTGKFALKRKPAIAILMVHGLGGTEETWIPILDTLTLSPHYFFRGAYLINSDKRFEFKPSPFAVSNEQSILIYTIRLSDNQNLSFNEQGEEVALVIPGILIDSRADKILLVGHSMGGLAIRAYLNRYGTKNIAGYISVTSPHMGSYLASLKRWANNEEYEDELTGNLSLRLKRVLVQVVDKAYPKISLHAKALDYLEPGSEALEDLHSHAFPELLPAATITSVWSGEDGSGFLIRRALKKISRSMEEMYAQDFTNAQLSKYNLIQRRDESDGVVSYPSQILEASVINGDKVKPYHLHTHVFHTHTHKQTVLVPAIDSVLSVYK